jgi:hypothetical protein
MTRIRGLIICTKIATQSCCVQGMQHPNLIFSLILSSFTKPAIMELFEPEKYVVNRFLIYIFPYTCTEFDCKISVFAFFCIFCEIVHKGLSRIGIIVVNPFRNHSSNKKFDVKIRVFRMLVSFAKFFASWRSNPERKSSIHSKTMISYS